MTEIHNFEDIEILGIYGGSINPDDLTQGGAVVELSSEPPEEWEEVLRNEVLDDHGGLLNQLIFKGSELHFWTRREDFVEAFQLLESAIDTANSVFRSRYSEILEAQRDLQKRIDRARKLRRSR